MQSHFYLLDMMALRVSPPLFFGLRRLMPCVFARPRFDYPYSKRSRSVPVSIRIGKAICDFGHRPAQSFYDHMVNRYGLRHESQ
jgi:hypothetical protein